MKLSTLSTLVNATSRNWSDDHSSEIRLGILNLPLRIPVETPVGFRVARIIGSRILLIGLRYGGGS